MTGAICFEINIWGPVIWFLFLCFIILERARGKRFGPQSVVQIWQGQITSIPWWLYRQNNSRCNVIFTDAWKLNTRHKLVKWKGFHSAGLGVTSVVCQVVTASWPVRVRHKQLAGSWTLEPRRRVQLRSLKSFP